VYATKRATSDPFAALGDHCHRTRHHLAGTTFGAQIRYLLTKYRKKRLSNDHRAVMISLKKEGVFGGYPQEYCL
jgi:hypothetical protein